MQKFKELIIMEYAKILLSAYPYLDGVIKQEGENYLRRCYNSAYFFSPTDDFCSKLISLYQDREKLIVLKNKLDVLFSRLSDEERDLLRFKFAGRMPEKKFSFSTRTYFRKQIKLLKKVEEYLNYLNITEEVFKKEYSKMEYFKVLGECVPEMIRIRNDARLKYACQGV